MYIHMYWTLYVCLLDFASSFTLLQECFFHMARAAYLDSVKQLPDSKSAIFGFPETRVGLFS
jgi:hypothetical protein